MKIKRFYSQTLRDALRQVKEELGSDAVILSNNKTDSGIELVAAVDYDHQQAVEKQKIKQQQEVTAETPAEKNEDWLSELKKLQFAKIDEQDREPDHFKLKKDVVSFSNAGRQTTKLEPHINDSKIDAVVNKQEFSSLLEQKKAKLIHQTMQSSRAINQYHNAQSDPVDATYRKPENIVKKAAAKPKTASSGSSRARVEWSQDPMLVAMKEEIKSLKDMLHHQVSGLAWGSFNRNNPHRSELLQRLFKLGLKPSISAKLIKYVNEPDSLENSWKKALSLISQGINIAADDILTDGGIVALVGSTGVGKTTSIAKLASRFTLQYGSKSLALVSTDSFRVGAQEQLKTYGQLLRVPVYTAADEQELKKILDKLRDKRLVLIDTAGMNQRDIRMTEQLSMLRRANPKIKLLSVLSAAAQSSTVYEVSRILKPFKVDGCLVTKVDESSSLGGIISTILEQQLPLHYITDGQKVPEDIHRGRASQLLKQAMTLVREQKDTYDYNDIALSFAGELLQVNG